MGSINSVKIGFIGFGNMATAMADGWIASGAIAGTQMCACAAHFDALKDKCATRGMTALPSAADVIQASELLVIAVKPGMVEDVLNPVFDELDGKIVLSVAWSWDNAAWDFAYPHAHHISTVPNTPVSVNEGVIAVENEHTLSDGEHALVMELLGLLGLTVELPSNALFVGGTVGGCAPAFIAMAIEALADAAVKHGIPRKAAYSIVSQMVLGTAKQQLVTEAHPAAMKDAVCSPAGATIKGVASLEEDGFRAALINAIDATLE